MNHNRKIAMLILIAALGYFVDVYDLILFIIVRQPSLTALGYTGTDLTREGILLLNLQMIGMLSGGTVWGILGDRKAGCRFCSARSCSIPSPIFSMV
ncbi:MAG: hypothetical protein QM743_12305 [Chitinophagaceae bacterium]